MTEGFPRRLQRLLPKYRPNCGAKIDGGKDDG